MTSKLARKNYPKYVHDEITCKIEFGHTERYLYKLNNIGFTFYDKFRPYSVSSKISSLK